MAARIDPSVLREMRRYGAFDIEACFNCGNCTAVCPLSKGNATFPRRVIRYAQLGLADHMAASRELWLCYYCTECSTTCPRQAEPGQFMAAARRWATAHFDPTTFSRRLYRSKAFSAGALIALLVLMVVVLLASSPGLPSGRATAESLLTFVPFDVIHWLGIGVIAVMVVAAVATLINMFWMMSRAPVPGGVGLPASRPERFPLGAALQALGTTISDIAQQRTYRDCGAEKTRTPRPLPLRRWLVHFCIMWGMVGLGLATLLDYLFKAPGSHVPIYYPFRLLGTIAGLAVVYGVTVAIVQRIRKPDKYYAHTELSDWVLLGFLWLIGVGGFILEVADYVPLGGVWIDVVFLLHVALAMELILLLPFTKFAHMVYRPAAIWFNEFRRLRSGQL
jgi:nitrate reductase gamma subunit/ferredoxin